MNEYKRQKKKSYSYKKYVLLANSDIRYGDLNNKDKKKINHKLQK